MVKLLASDRSFGSNSAQFLLQPAVLVFHLVNFHCLLHRPQVHKSHCFRFCGTQSINFCNVAIIWLFESLWQAIPRYRCKSCLRFLHWSSEQSRVLCWFDSFCWLQTHHIGLWRYYNFTAWFLDFSKEMYRTFYQETGNQWSWETRYKIAILECSGLVRGYSYAFGSWGLESCLRCLTISWWPVEAC